MKAKTVALFVVAAILVLGAPFLGSKILSFMAEREWAVVEAEVKEVSLPLTPEEALKDYQPGPDVENAAEGVKVVLRTVMNPPKAANTNEFLGGFKPEFKKASDGMSKTIADLFEPGTKPDWTKLRQAVNVFKAPLERLEREIQKPDWNFKRPWKQGHALLLPDGAHLKQLCRMLGAKARVAMHDGNFPAALASIQAMIRLGRHMQTEPILILILVGVSCESMACQTILDLPRIQPLTPTQTKTLAALTVAKGAEIDWRRIWRTESANSVAMMKLFLTEKGLRDIGLKESDGYALYSQHKYLTAKSKVVRILIQAERDWQSKPTDPETATHMAVKYADSVAEAFGQYSDIYSMLSSGGSADDPMVNTIAARKRQLVLQRLTFLALQIAAQPRGKWILPADSAKPEWSDPFTGKPMLLTRNANGFRLYSVGQNSIDDGGKIEKDANDDPLDIVVSFPSR